MELSPHPTSLGGPAGGGSSYYHHLLPPLPAELLSSVTTITQPEMPTITAGAPTIRPKLGAYYHHDLAGGGLTNDVPGH